MSSPLRHPSPARQTALAGFAIAYRADLPVGPTDVALGFALFAVSAAARRIKRS